MKRNMKRNMKSGLSLLLALVLAAALTTAWGEESAVRLDDLTRQYGFRAGAPLSYGQLADPDYLALLAQHFSSLTATNEMKAYSLLDQRKSKMSEDGMPVMDWRKADQMVAWAKKNGIGVRGHVLVWDAYMNDWFFREGYDSKNPYADQETVRRRTESYITQVVTHFEEKFPGVVYCWDVVNEAVGDNAGEYEASDPRHLRTLRSGEKNLFREHMGDDYVELSFLYARNAVESLGADIRLYYNDYNAFFPEKAKAILALADSINRYAEADGKPRRLLDGIGMQGYIGGYGQQQGCLDEGQLKMIRSAILGYAQAGYEVQITEMAVRNFRQDRADAHAAYYGKLFQTLKELTEETDALKAVSIWGLTDYPNEPKGTYVYNLNSPYGGLFTEKLEPKAAFAEVCGVLSR